MKVAGTARVAKSVSTPLTSADQPEVLTAEQVAVLLQIKAEQVYRLARHGDLPCVRIGRLVRFRRSTVLSWLAEHESEPFPFGGMGRS